MLIKLAGLRVGGFSVGRVGAQKAKCHRCGGYTWARLNPTRARLPWAAAGSRSPGRVCSVDRCPAPIAVVVPGRRPPFAFLDIDETIIEVYGHQKQGAGFGYSGVRGLNALIATLSSFASAPVIISQRLRKGACGSPRGAKRMVADALRTGRRLLGPNHPILVRADSAFYDNVRPSA